jgi:hypothetical protein
VCHRTVSGAPGWILSNSLGSGIWGGRSAIIHRTVLCSTGLSGVPGGATVVRANGRLQRYSETLQCRCRSTSRRREHCHRHYFRYGCHRSSLLYHPHRLTFSRVCIRVANGGMSVAGVGAAVMASSAAHRPPWVGKNKRGPLIA